MPTSSPPAGSAGAGLTRPELAVLLANAKSELSAALAGAAVMWDREIAEAVEAYFPPPVTARFGALIRKHRLYAQLAATAVSSEIVDRMGITWAHETAEQFGVSLPDAAAAYWAARQVLGADRRWRALEAVAPGLSPDAEHVLHQAVASAVDVVARTYLTRREVQLAGVVAEDRPVLAAMAGIRESAPPGHNDLSVDDIAGRGIARELAGEWTGLGTLSQVADVAQAARTLGRDPADVLEGFDAADGALGLAAVEDALHGAHPVGRWERWEQRAQLDDLRRLRREAVTAAMGEAPGKPPPAAVLDWAAERDGRLRRYRRLISQIDLPAGDTLCLGGLAARALSDVIDKG